MGTEDVEARSWNHLGPSSEYALGLPQLLVLRCTADNSISHWPSGNPTSVTRGEGPADTPKRPELRIHHRNSKTFSPSLQLLAIADAPICSPPRDACEGLYSTWPTRNEGLLHLLPIPARECLRSNKNQLLCLLAILGKDWGIVPFLCLWRYRDQRQTPEAENSQLFPGINRNRRPLSPMTPKDAIPRLETKAPPLNVCLKSTHAQTRFLASPA